MIPPIAHLLIVLFILRYNSPWQYNQSNRALELGVRPPLGPCVPLILLELDEAEIHGELKRVTNKADEANY